MRVSRSFLSAVAVLALLHIYIGWRLLPDLPLGIAGRITGVAVLLSSCALMPLSMMIRSIRQPLADRIAWAGLTAMGFFSSLLVLTLLRDVALGLAGLLFPNDETSAVSAVLVIGLAIFMTLAGFVNARRRARVVDVDIPVAGLPAELQGFSIVQISDVHVGPTIKRAYVEAIVEAVNELKADLIAVTGDLVDGSVQQLAAHVAPLARLKIGRAHV